MYLPLQVITSQRESERDHTQKMSDTCSLVLMHTDNEFLPVSTWQASASLLTALQLVFNITQHVFQTNCLSPALHTPPSEHRPGRHYLSCVENTTNLSLSLMLPVYFSTLFVVLSRKGDFSQSNEWYMLLRGGRYVQNLISWYDLFYITIMTSHNKVIFFF